MFAVRAVGVEGNLVMEATSASGLEEDVLEEVYDACGLFENANGRDIAVL